MDPISNIALASGLSWASGFRLYATVFIVGMLAKMDWIMLPESLSILSNSTVLAISGFLMVIEFIADKVPYIDSTWDSVQTFIRIPLGALLAMGAINSSDPMIATVVALLGGTLTGMTHATKTGTRAMVNTSPEPITNVATSATEDAVFLTGGWLALAHPAVFLGILLIFIMFMLWVIPKLWRGLVKVLTNIGKIIKPADTG